MKAELRHGHRVARYSSEGAKEMWLDRIPISDYLSHHSSVCLAVLTEPFDRFVEASVEEGRSVWIQGVRQGDVRVDPLETMVRQRKGT
jgi:hypothetical protein